MSMVQYDVPRHGFPSPMPARAPGAAAAACDGAGAAHAGRTACLRLFERLGKLTPGCWRALPAARGHADRALDTVLDGTVSSASAYTIIAAEAGRALEHGVRGTTPPALLLLAALALEHKHEHRHPPGIGSGGGDDAALRLAGIALDLAARQGGARHARLCALHAALIRPLAGTLDQAARELGALCAGPDAPPATHVQWAGAAFAGGMPLPALARQLELARQPAAAGNGGDGGAAAELAARARLLDGLLHARPAPDPPGAGQPRHAGFGLWLARLQAAWYAGDQAGALHAAEAAGVLAGPWLALGDRLICHLFAALALSRSPRGTAGAAPDPLERHCAALRRLPGAHHFGTLAEAARARHAGHRPDALRGFEQAGAGAGTDGRHWLAALAWEEAGLLAEECGLPSASAQYRRQAIASYRSWGALGRAETLGRRWGLADAGAGTDASGADIGLSIAHEVNQPLAAVSLHAAAARRWLHRPQPDIERALASLLMISAAGRQAGDIVRSMQRLATRRSGAPGSGMDDVPVDRVIADTLQLQGRLLRRHGIAAEPALGLGECVIHADRVQLQQVVTNLLVNAVEALAGTQTKARAAAGSKRIRVQSRRAGADEIEISVTDNGPGIAPEHRDRVFGSLFSTKPGGTGMGLSISLAIVRAHGGHIGYEPAAPHGACFRLRLPLRAGRH